MPKCGVFNMNYIEKIESIHPEVIDSFIRTGESVVIPTDLQHIIMQMVFAIQIYSKERNISRAAEKLRLRTLAEQGENLNVTTAKSRIYAAINYFDVESNVEEAVLLRDAANKYEDMCRLALIKGQISVADRCLTKALDCRLKATSADKQSTLGVVYLMSDEIRPEDIGFTSTSKKEIARKANDGVYLKMINSLDVPEAEKRRLRADADVEFEEIEDDEQK